MRTRHTVIESSHGELTLVAGGNTLTGRVFPAALAWAHSATDWGAVAVDMIEVGCGCFRS